VLGLGEQGVLLPVLGGGGLGGGGLGGAVVLGAVGGRGLAGGGRLGRVGGVVGGAGLVVGTGRVGGGLVLGGGPVAVGLAGGDPDAGRRVRGQRGRVAGGRGAGLLERVGHVQGAKLGDNTQAAVRRDGRRRAAEGRSRGNAGHGGQGRADDRGLARGFLGGPVSGPVSSAVTSAIAGLDLG
jgi:hypothetical protein